MLRQYSPAFLFSVFFHIVVLAILIVSFEFSSTMPVVENSDKDLKVISAVVMDTLSPAPAPLPAASAQPQIQKSEKTISKPDPAELQKQAIALNIQRKKNTILQKEALAKQLLEDVKKQTQAQKKLKQKSLEAAFAKELKEQAAKNLERQLHQEQLKIAGSKMQGEVNKYKALILQAISQQWLVPASVNKKLYTDLLIHLAPGGMVLDVQITRSSGNVALDRSARDAVFKASPLPVPTETQEFNQFRQFVLRVKPESVLSDV
ncbi:MAG: cell envelope integrity protein TolA [Gammaproteobacteria bacterium]|nr:cell envelope integrity protein TolA [Gammaproteobacteria bacterium]